MRKLLEKILAIYRKLRSRKSLDVRQRVQKAIHRDRQESHSK